MTTSRLGRGKKNTSSWGPTPDRRQGRRNYDGRTDVSPPRRNFRGQEEGPGCGREDGPRFSGPSRRTDTSRRRDGDGSDAHGRLTHGGHRDTKERDSPGETRKGLGSRHGAVGRTGQLLYKRTSESVNAIKRGTQGPRNRRPPNLTTERKERVVSSVRYTIHVSRS